MKVFSLLSLDRNLVNFKSTRRSNIIHHVDWCTVLLAQYPYGCGVLFICAWAYQSLYPDKRNAPHFFCIILARSSQIRNPAMEYSELLWRLFCYSVITEQIRKGVFGRYVYKYFSLDKRNIEILREKSLWFSKFGDFKDQLEGKLIPPYRYFNEIITLEYKEEINVSLLKEIGASYLSVFNNLQNNYCMCSFCRTWDNLNLWGQYGGFCLEFDVLQDVDFFNCLLPMQYEETFTQTDLINSPDEIIPQLFQRKCAVFSNEDEIRLYKIGERGPRKYNDSTLKGVYFDERVSVSQRENIINILGNKLRYSIVQVGDDSNRLIKRDI